MTRGQIFNAYLDPNQFDLSVFIHNTITYVQELIQRYGWYFVFLCLAWYFSIDFRRDFAAQRSLSAANDPVRVELLNVQRDKARAKQALAAAKQNKED